MGKLLNKNIFIIIFFKYNISMNYFDQYDEQKFN